MQMRKWKIRTSYVLTIIINIVLFGAVVFLMNHVERLFRSDVRINLTEIVTQNKDVISSKLKLEVNSLDLISKQISDRIEISKDASRENIKKIFFDYNGDPMLTYADIEGNAIYSGGQEVNIAGRNYFKLSLQGKQNISERIISRLNGEDIFVISVPLIYKDEIIGTIQKQYTPEEMYNICSLSLFSQQGSMYIINSEGYILISSEQGEEYNKESSNYYRMAYVDDPANARMLEENVKAKKEGFIEINIEGVALFSAYTPIEEVHDWYLITSIESTAIIPNSNIVIKIFYVILSVIVLTFAIMMFYFLRIKKKQQAHLEDIAFVDKVTGGDSYAKFLLNLQSINEADRSMYSILSFDIDNFKYINSFYGFDRGDQLLKEVYQLYQNQLKQHECIARNYADHFVVLLKDVTDERLRELFCSERIVQDMKVYFSAGIYQLNSADDNLLLTIDKANLVSQKAKGKRFKEVEVYTKDFDEQVMNNERIKRLLEQAFIDDEITPFFQPKVDVNTNKLVGAEALARWITKEGKMISPAEFIPVCEKTGMIDTLDWIIFEKTLIFIRHNLDVGNPCVPISVNFSRVHLLNKDFVQMLEVKLNMYDVPGEYIEVELTETIIFDNSHDIDMFIEGMHSIGIKVSMDDFGSGYSSLQMLKDVDIDVLKIDQGFLRSTSNKKKQQIIFQAIVQMAKELQMKLVVEGIETIDNVELMKEAGCAIAQGYFYSKPVDVETFQKYYEEGTL